MYCTECGNRCEKRPQTAADGEPVQFECFDCNRVYTLRSADGVVSLIEVSNRGATRSAPTPRL